MVDVFGRCYCLNIERENVKVPISFVSSLWPWYCLMNSDPLAFASGE